MLSTFGILVGSISHPFFVFVHNSLILLGMFVHHMVYRPTVLGGCRRNSRRGNYLGITGMGFCPVSRIKYTFASTPVLSRASYCCSKGLPPFSSLLRSFCTSCGSHRGRGDLIKWYVGILGVDCVRGRDAGTACVIVFSFPNYQNSWIFKVRGQTDIRFEIYQQKKYFLLIFNGFIDIWCFRMTFLLFGHSVNFVMAV